MLGFYFCLIKNWRSNHIIKPPTATIFQCKNIRHHRKTLTSCIDKKFNLWISMNCFPQFTRTKNTNKAASEYTYSNPPYVQSDPLSSTISSINIYMKLKSKNTIQDYPNLSLSCYHRGALPVLHYPRNMVIYHYPSVWVIFTVIDTFLLSKITLICSQIITLKTQFE